MGQLTITLGIAMILNKLLGKHCNTVGFVSKRFFFLWTVNVDVLACHVSVKSVIKDKVKANLNP